MAAPLLDGSAVFGVSTICIGPTSHPRREQKANYPGLDGTERLDMGDQGKVTVITGRLFGATEGDLASAFGNLDSYADGQLHVLTDARGTTWSNVIVGSPEPEGRGQFTPDLGYTQRYSIQLFHLTNK